MYEAKKSKFGEQRLSIERRVTN